MKKLIVCFLLVVVNNAKYLGCWVDDTERAMALDEGKNGVNTVECCVDTCTEKGYKYAGLEEGTRCFCGDGYEKHGEATEETECDQMCPGNSTQVCGGMWRLSVYTAAFVPEPEPEDVVKPEVDLGTEYIGCFTDKEGVTEKAMPEYQEQFPGTNCIEKCAKTCALLEYKYSGTQADWCYCSDTPDRYSEVHHDECYISCPGNSLKECGGDLRLSVFTSGYMGCWKDDGANRAMEFAAYNGNPDATMSIESCLRTCTDAGFDYSGVQEGNLCFCGNDYTKYYELNFWDCSSECAGDETQICGGTLKNSVFKTYKPVQPTYHDFNMDLDSLDDFVF